ELRDAPAVELAFRGPRLWRRPALSSRPALRQGLLEALKEAEATLEGQLRRLLEDFRNAGPSQRLLGWKRSRDRERHYKQNCVGVLDALSKVRRRTRELQASTCDERHDLTHIAQAGDVSKCLAECCQLSLNSIPEATRGTAEPPVAAVLQRARSLPPPATGRVRSPERNAEISRT
ncbi:unnamed protein product, partial [Prorocentrum cordatum]